MVGTASDIWMYTRDVATFWKVISSTRPLLLKAGCQTVKDGRSASYTIENYGANEFGIKRCGKAGLIYQVSFWVVPEANSVLVEHGRAPVLAQPVDLDVAIRTRLTGKTPAVYAIDVQGQRARRIPAELTAGQVRFTTGRQAATIYFEIRLE